MHRKDKRKHEKKERKLYNYLKKSLSDLKINFIHELQ